MRVVIDRNSLNELLSSVSVAGTNNTYPILANVALIASEDGTLTAVGNNLQQEVSASTRCEVIESGAITVIYKRLKEIAQSLPETASISLELIENEKLSVRSGRSKFSMATLPFEQFPRIETGAEGEQIVLKRTDLLTCLKGTSFCAAKVDVRAYLNGVLIETDTNTINFVGTDGHRLSHMSLAVDTENARRVILPTKAVAEIIKMASQATTETLILTLNDQHVVVTDGTTTLSTVLIGGNYPDYRRVIPKNNQRTAFVSKHAFMGLLKRAATLTDEKVRLVKLTFADNKLIAESKNAQEEFSEDEIEINYSQEPLTIGLNLTYISEIIANTGADEIEVKLGDAQAALLVTPAGKNNQVLIQMPMRL